MHLGPARPCCRPVMAWTYSYSWPREGGTWRRFWARSQGFKGCWLEHGNTRRGPPNSSAKEERRTPFWNRSRSASLGGARRAAEHGPGAAVFYGSAKPIGKPVVAVVVPSVVSCETKDLETLRRFFSSHRPPRTGGPRGRKTKSGRSETPREGPSGLQVGRSNRGSGFSLMVRQDLVPKSSSPQTSNIGGQTLLT